jgi:hypothetical protein
MADGARGFSFIAPTCHQPASVLNLVKDANAPLRDGLYERPSLTRFPRGGLSMVGRDEGTGALRIEQRNI